MNGSWGGDGEGAQCCAHTMADCTTLPSPSLGNTPFFTPEVRRSKTFAQINLFLNIHTLIQQYPDSGNTQRDRNIQIRVITGWFSLQNQKNNITSGFERGREAESHTQGIFQCTRTSGWSECTMATVYAGALSHSEHPYTETTKLTASI